MARLPLAAVERMGPEAREQYERFPSNLTRALLLLDQRLARVLPESANALRASALPDRLREAAILRVAALSGSAYERMQHLGPAAGAGWSEEQIVAIESGVHSHLPDDVLAVLDFVDECVASPQVSDAAFAAARAVLDDRELVTLIVLIGHYMTVARLTSILAVELDEKPSDWTSEH